MKYSRKTIDKVNPFILVCFLLLSLLLLESCGIRRYITPLPIDDIPSEYINTYVRIKAPSGWTRVKYGNRIVVDVDNISDKILYFSNEYNIQAYMFTDSNWMKLEKEIYKKDDVVICLYPTKGDSSRTPVAIITPVIDDIEGPIIVRIVISGRLKRDTLENDQLVAAYTDVLVYP